MKNSAHGFTIVELLVVIVVIGILTAIGIVSYVGVQQNANNTKTTTDARTVVNLVESYQSTFGAFPASATSCATRDNHCTTDTGVVRSTANTSLMTELSKIGTPPESARIKAANGAYGVTYTWEPTRTIGGVVYPVRIEYFLQGSEQSCGIDNVANGTITGFSTTGYSASFTGSSARTVCWILIKE